MTSGTKHVITSRIPARIESEFRAPCTACGRWECGMCGKSIDYANRRYTGIFTCTCGSQVGTMVPIRHRVYMGEFHHSQNGDTIRVTE